VLSCIENELCDFLTLTSSTSASSASSGYDRVILSRLPNFKSFLSRPVTSSSGFILHVANGHNLLCSLYLRNCGNKSIAVEHPCQAYLKTYGPAHLRQSTRGLRKFCTHIRKIDETSGIRGVLPYQLGYVVGLQELYARRVGISGVIPKVLKKALVADEI